MIEIEQGSKMLARCDESTGDGFGGRFQPWVLESSVLDQTRRESVFISVLDMKREVVSGPLVFAVGPGDGTGGRV